MTASQIYDVIKDIKKNELRFQSPLDFFFVFCFFLNKQSFRFYGNLDCFFNNQGFVYRCQIFRIFFKLSVISCVTVRTESNLGEFPLQFPLIKPRLALVSAILLVLSQTITDITYVLGDSNDPMRSYLLVTPAIFSLKIVFVW